MIRILLLQSLFDPNLAEVRSKNFSVDYYRFLFIQKINPRPNRAKVTITSSVKSNQSMGKPLATVAVLTCACPSFQGLTDPGENSDRSIMDVTVRGFKYAKLRNLGANFSTLRVGRLRASRTDFSFQRLGACSGLEAGCFSR